MKVFFLLLSFFITPAWAIEHAIVAAYAVDDQGNVVYDHNSDLSMMPASCLKIVTTATALEILGPDFRFETTLEYDGKIEQGTLLGNIYIHGGGDPTLGSERFGSSWHKQIDLWVNAIKDLGIQAIKGQVIGDSSFFEKAMAPSSWQWDDLGNYYGAGASGLSIHENMYKLELKPGEKVGDQTTILKIDPSLTFLEFENDVKTGRANSGDCACIYGSEYSSKRVVRGTIPLGVDEFTIKGSMSDPPKECAKLLESALEEAEIAISAKQIPEGKRVVFHKTTSPRLAAIVHQTNQKSINLYAEHLFKKMGGAQAIKDYWTKKGLDLTGFHLADGSGLSRKNMVTAKELVAILQHMKGSTAFFGSLTNGFKTGSMSQVRGKAGYKDDITYAIFINHGLDSETMTKKIDSFLFSFQKIDK